MPDGSVACQQRAAPNQATARLASGFCDSPAATAASMDVMPTAAACLLAACDRALLCLRAAKTPRAQPRGSVHGVRERVVAVPS